MDVLLDQLRAVFVTRLLLRPTHAAFKVPQALCWLFLVDFDVPGDARWSFWSVMTNSAHHKGPLSPATTRAAEPESVTGLIIERAG